MSVSSNFSVAGYITIPEINGIIASARSEGKTWDNIAESLSARIKQPMTGNAIRKAWNLRKNTPENENLHRLVLSAYVSVPENMEMINHLRNKKQMTWAEIADIIQAKEGKVVGENALQNAWSKVVSVGYDVKQATQSIDIILDPEIHYMIGVMKNVNMKTWREIRNYISTRYGYKISVSHVEDTWHEGVKRGMKVPVRFSAKDFMLSVDGYAEVKKWLSENKTWREIAEILKIRLGYELSPRTIRDYYSEADKSVLDKHQEYKNFLLHTMWMRIQEWRYEKFVSWQVVAERVSKEYGDEIDANTVQNIVVKHMDFLKADKIRKEQNEKKKIMKNGKVFSASEYVSDPENYEEIKMWNTRYSWREIADRICKRMGVQVTPATIKNAWYKV